MRTVALILSLCLLAGASAAQPSAYGSDAQLRRLHDDLRLTPMQEVAWNAYVAGAAPDEQVEAHRRATAERLPTLTTPGRIALVAQTLTIDQVEFRRQGAFVIDFYNQLTPEQQRTYDRETIPPSER